MNVDWPSIIIGAVFGAVIFGFPVTYCATWLYDKCKEKSRRKRSYIFLTNASEEGIVEFEGRVWAHTAMGTAVKEIAEQVLGEMSEPSDSNKNKKATIKRTVKPLTIKRLITYWLIPVWVILALALLFSIISLTTSHFDWVITARLLRTLLPIFVLFLAIMYVLWYFIPRWSLETGIITLSIMLIVFLFASGNNVSFGIQIRDYLSGIFDINFFSTGMTIAALLIALNAIYVQQRKQKRK